MGYFLLGLIAGMVLIIVVASIGVSDDCDY